MQSRMRFALAVAAVALLLSGCDMIPRGANPSQNEGCSPRGSHEPPRKVLGVEIYDDGDP